MSIYTANSNSYKSFTLFKDDNNIGSLHYPKWFSFNAEVNLENGHLYTIAPKGFWDASIEFKEGDKTLINFKMGWKGIMINTFDNGIENSYLLKLKGLISSTYLLLDNDGQELVAIKSEFNWKNFGYKYVVETSDHFESLKHASLLIFAMLHAINYQMTMIVAAS